MKILMARFNDSHVEAALIKFIQRRWNVSANEIEYQTRWALGAEAQNWSREMLRHLRLFSM